MENVGRTQGELELCLSLTLGTTQGELELCLWLTLG